MDNATVIALLNGKVCEECYWLTKPYGGAVTHCILRIELDGEFTEKSLIPNFRNYACSRFSLVINEFSFDREI